MNRPKTNKPILSKRVSASGKNVKKPKQTNVSIIETISPLISTRTQNDSTCPKTTTTTVAKILSDADKAIAPAIVPRTTFPYKPKIEQESTSNTDNNTNNKSDLIEEEKQVLPSINSTNHVSSNKHIPGLCGLINIGNTCYMNSALQCLSNIPELTQWAKDQQHLSNSNRDIIFVYTSLIQSMWSGKNSSIDPRELKKMVSHSAPIFADYAQKDSHEFMNSLLNALERMNSASIIAKLFHIHTQSQVTCLSCNTIDHTDEITTFLPLPLPQKTSSRTHILLKTLIDDYCLEENLDGLYYCRKCQTCTQAKQKTIICLPLPRVLIIQLKRFPFNGTYQKIDTFVQYELQHKNLISDNDIYQLCAVSSHAGSLAGGHYTTLAKNSIMKQWYNFNDTRVNKITSDSVITPNAYILIYLKSKTLDDSLFS